MDRLGFEGSRAWHALREKGDVFLLVLISSLLSVPFVIKGSLPGDGLRYALSVRRVVEEGVSQVSQAFNGEMSVGYYLLLHGLFKVTGAGTEVSVMLNNLNAIVSIILALLLYYFFLSLTSKRSTAFFACLAVLLSPAIWLLSHAGHPGLIALTLFVGSALVLDLILRDSARTSDPVLLWAGFVILCSSAMAMRLDIVLSFGAYVGLVLYRRASSLKILREAFAAMMLVVVMYASVRYSVLGYLLTPGGGTVAYHVSQRAQPKHIVLNTIKYGVSWAMGTNALIFLLGVIGVVALRRQTRLGLLLILWSVPYCIFFLFHGMDFSRLAAPSIPIIALLAIEFVGSSMRQRVGLALASTLALSQLASVALYYPLVALYPFKMRLDHRPIADIPIGFLLSDHSYRQRALTAQMRDAQEVTSERARDVAIVGYGVMPYEFSLKQAGDVVFKGQEACSGLVYTRYATPGNEFFVLNLMQDPQVVSPLRTFSECLNPRQVRLHIIPISRDATLKLEKGE